MYKPEPKKILLAATIMVILFSSHTVHAATLSFVSGVTNASIGDTINVSVRIDSQGQTVNATQATIDYPKSILQVVQVDHSNSIFNIWAQEPSVSTSTGEISFLGGSTNSFSGTSLYVLNITFTVRGTGLATLDFANAGVTAGDGTGANILSGSTNVSFRVGAANSGITTTTNATSASQAAVLQVSLPAPTQIKRPAISTTTIPGVPVLLVGLYPDQNGWYNALENFLVQWQLPADVTDVATALNQNPQFNPTVSEGLFDNKTFGALSDGIWYLHIRFKNSAGWGPAAHYRIAIDTTPPLPFTATIKEGSVTQVSAPTVQFETRAVPSGIGFYQIFADGNIVGTTTNTSFTLPSLSFGSHSIVVQAVDNAGNITASLLSVTVAAPTFFAIGDLKITEGVFFGTIIFVIVISVLIGLWLGRKERMQRKNRAIIAGRDVTSAFNVIQKNLEKLADYCKNASMMASHQEDISFLLKEIREKTDTMKHYVSENVEEIEQ